MKSVIKKQTHYNLLLMRDDGAARSFRMHSRLLRFFIFLFLLLLAAGALGIYGGTHYWKKYRVLAERHAAQEREAGEMRLQLERLCNLESVIAASNGLPAQAQNQNQEVGVSLPSATRPSTQETVATDAEAGAVAVADPAPGATESGEPATGEQGQLTSGDSPLRIANFSLRSSGTQRLRVSYELSASQPDEQRTLSGSVRYGAVLTDGTKIELSMQDAEGSSFAIVRMKPMQSTLRLPQEHKPSDIAQIEVFIEIAGGSLYQDSFAVTL